MVKGAVTKKKVPKHNFESEDGPKDLNNKSDSEDPVNNVNIKAEEAEEALAVNFADGTGLDWTAVHPQSPEQAQDVEIEVSYVDEMKPLSDESDSGLTSDSDDDERQDSNDENDDDDEEDDYQEVTDQEEFDQMDQGGDQEDRGEMYGIPRGIDHLAGTEACSGLTLAE